MCLLDDVCLIESNVSTLPPRFIHVPGTYIANIVATSTYSESACGARDYRS